jgi:hypothetical protein
MKTKIVTTVMDIQLVGEFKHFEVRIPDNVKSIDGVETSVRFATDIWNPIEMSTLVVMNKSYVIGDLRLNGGKHNNWFYSHTIQECLTAYKEDMGSFQQNAICFQPIHYSKKREGDNFNIIPIGTRIKGYFKDIIGVNLETNLQYSVTISIHLSTH